MKDRHQFEIGTHLACITSLESLETAVEEDPAVMDHCDPGFQAFQQILVVCDDDACPFRLAGPVLEMGGMDQVVNVGGTGWVEAGVGSS